MTSATAWLTIGEADKDIMPVALGPNAFRLKFVILNTPQRITGDRLTVLWFCAIQLETYGKWLAKFRSLLLGNSGQQEMKHFISFFTARFHYKCLREHLWKRN